MIRFQSEKNRQIILHQHYQWNYQRTRIQTHHFQINQRNLIHQMIEIAVNQRKKRDKNKNRRKDRKYYS